MHTLLRCAPRSDVHRRRPRSIVQRIQSCSAFNRAARSITRHVQSRCAFERGVRQGRNRAPTPRRALVCLKISTPNASQAAQGRRVDGSLAAGCSSVHLTQAQRRCYTSAHHPSGRALPLLSPPSSFFSPFFLTFPSLSFLWKSTSLHTTRRRTPSSLPSCQSSRSISRRTNGERVVHST